MLHSKECAKKYIGGHLMFDKEMPKRKRLSSKKNVDMDKVGKLEDIMNNMFCNLRPERSRIKCFSCPHRTFCKNSKAERSYIYKKNLKRRDGIIHQRKKSDTDMKIGVEEQEFSSEERDHIEMAEQLANNGWGWE